MKRKDRSQSDYSLAVRKSAIKAALSCAVWWGVSIFVMLIGAFIFLTDAIGIIVAALLGACLLLLPAFKFNLFQLCSFEGTVTAIDYRRRYKLYMIKPGVGEHAVQNRSEYTIYVQKDNGKTATVTYVVKEDRELPYQKGDRVRYRWGVTYLQILSMQSDHLTVCPFCGQDQHKDTQVCRRCRKRIIDKEYEQSEERS